MFYEKKFRPFTLYHFPFYSIQDESVRWSHEKPKSQRKLEIGNLSCSIYNSKDFLQKTYTNCIVILQLPDIEKKKKFLV